MESFKYRLKQSPCAFGKCRNEKAFIDAFGLCLADGSTKKADGRTF